MEDFRNEYCMHTATCGQLRATDVNQEVTLCGWAWHTRDHGGLIFIDLRDRDGYTQVVVDPDCVSEEDFHAAEHLGREYVLKVSGRVRERAPEAINPNMITGEIEVLANAVEVLNTSVTPPFSIEDGIETDEITRMKWRYLDIRRPEMLANLKLRHTVTQAMRRALDERGFLEIETPILANSTPEGARDFMVASNEPAPVYIAVNALKAATDEEVVSVLAAAHAEPEAMALGGCAVPGCYKVASGVPLLDGRVRRMINQGLLLVSDATSQAVADLVVGDTAPESFLEIGAGRATKTILDQSIAYRRHGKQIPEYVTVDVHAFKTKLLQERAEQYGAHVSEAIIGDATDLDALVGERTFDRVFIDSPCTGLGTLRRHADIRWRLRPETIAESAELDARLLESAASHVAPGGILAYATCTVTHEENADAVEAFLATEAGAAFEVVPCRNPDLDIELPFFSTVLEPGGPDAHFLALLRRKA